MPYHQAALAVEQLSALPHLPVLAAGLRGVQHTEAPGRVPSLVHRPEHGQLATPGSPSRASNSPAAEAASTCWHPRSHSGPEPTRPARNMREGAGALAVGRLPDPISLTCTTPPKRPSPRMGGGVLLQYDPGDGRGHVPRADAGILWQDAVTELSRQDEPLPVPALWMTGRRSSHCILASHRSTPFQPSWQASPVAPGPGLARRRRARSAVTMRWSHVQRRAWPRLT